MANMNYSRQREAIKDFLSGTTSHPTADTVYRAMREQFPNISLGTVYRNLNLLVSTGDLIKITAPDNIDRFDATVKPHFHVFCKCCGKVSDISLNTTDQLHEAASESYDGVIESCTLVFRGICRDCLEEETEQVKA